MLKLLLICCFFTTSLCVQAQIPDFISVKKKNGVSVKNYYAGLDISFVTTDGRKYDALIDKIKNDSIFLRYFDVYPYTNVLGTVSYDTLTTYILPIHYKDIKTVLVPKINYRNHYIGTLGKFATIGGFGYDFLNVFNGLYQKAKPLFSPRDIRNVSIATGVGALGLFLNKKFRNPKKANRYKIVYVNMH